MGTKQIYSVIENIANGETNGEFLLACFANKEDARAYMKSKWDNEVPKAYFREFDKAYVEMTGDVMEAWNGNDYANKHYNIAIKTTNLK